MKKDMSKSCGMHYEEYWKKTNMDGTMSQEEMDSWFAKNCAKCCWMSEICMFGEK